MTAAGSRSARSSLRAMPRSTTSVAAVRRAAMYRSASAAEVGVVLVFGDEREVGLAGWGAQELDQLRSGRGGDRICVGAVVRPGLLR